MNILKYINGYKPLFILKNDAERFTVKELSAFCNEFKISHSGIKEKIVENILEFNQKMIDRTNSVIVEDLKENEELDEKDISNDEFDVKEEDIIDIDISAVNKNPKRFLKYKGIYIESREEDNFINATQMCAAGGKKINHWLELESTKNLINALEKEINNSETETSNKNYNIGIPIFNNDDTGTNHNKNYENSKNCESSKNNINNSETETSIKILNTGIPVLNNNHTGSNHNKVIDIKVGGRNGGTWIHYKLAVPLACWIDSDFYLEVSNWTFELLTTGSVSIKPQKQLTSETQSKMVIKTSNLNFEAKELGDKIDISKTVNQGNYLYMILVNDRFVKMGYASIYGERIEQHKKDKSYSFCIPFYVKKDVSQSTERSIHKFLCKYRTNDIDNQREIYFIPEDKELKWFIELVENVISELGINDTKIDELETTVVELNKTLYDVRYESEKIKYESEKIKYEVLLQQKEKELENEKLNTKLALKDNEILKLEKEQEMKDLMYKYEKEKYEFCIQNLKEKPTQQNNTVNNTNNVIIPMQNMRILTPEEIRKQEVKEIRKKIYDQTETIKREMEKMNNKFIIQTDLRYNIINQFPSIEIASDMLNIDEDVIRRYINGESMHNNFLFNTDKTNGNLVLQFDCKTADYICMYTSSTKAAKHFNIDPKSLRKNYIRDKKIIDEIYILTSI